MNLSPGFDDNVLLVVMLVLPGFISILTFETLVPGRNRSTGREMLDALGYGAVNTGIWLPVLIASRNWLLPRPTRLVLLMFGVLVISPILLAIGARWALAQPFAKRWLINLIPSAWDTFFSTRERAWMRVKLKSGDVVGGFFGPGSSAGSNPGDRDLYLEAQWRLDPGTAAFENEMVRSKGVLIKADEWEYIELFEREEATDDRSDGRSKVRPRPRSK